MRLGDKIFIVFYRTFFNLPTIYNKKVINE